MTGDVPRREARPAPSLSEDLPIRPFWVLRLQTH